MPFWNRKKKRRPYQSVDSDDGGYAPSDNSPSYSPDPTPSPSYDSGGYDSGPSYSDGGSSSFSSSD